MKMAAALVPPPPIKPAQSALLIYCATEGKQLRAQYPDLSRREFAEIQAEKWKALTDAQLQRKGGRTQYAARKRVPHGEAYHGRDT